MELSKDVGVFDGKRAAVISIVSRALCAVLLLLIACVFAAPADAQFHKRATAYRATGPLEIDGRLDEASWASVARLGPFADLESSAKARNETFSRLLWDDDYLYIAFECEDPDVRATKSRRDQRVNEDDMVEVQLDPDGDGRDYLIFSVNPLNTLGDRHQERAYTEGEDDIYHLDWDAEGVLTGVHIEGTLEERADRDRRWSVEIGLPWKALETYAGGQQVPPTEDSVWRVGLYRLDLWGEGDDEGHEKTAWSPTRQRFWEDAERFGAVLFSEETAMDRPALSLAKYATRNPARSDERRSLPAPGEELVVEVTLRNQGNRTATDITATLRGTDPQVTVLDSVVEVGRIDALDTATAGSFRLQVGMGYTPNTPLPVRLHLRDRSDRRWVEGLDLYLDFIEDRPYSRRDVEGKRFVALTTWRYHPGDDMAWADPAFDDSSWELVNSILTRDDLPEAGWQGIGWFRRRAMVDSTLWNRSLALIVEESSGAAEIYLDGRLLYTLGTVGTSAAEEEARRDPNPKVIPLDDSPAHVIAVRFSNFSAEQFFALRGPAGFSLALAGLNESIARRAENARESSVYQTVATVLPLVLAILHLLLFLFYPRHRQNLYYAVSTALFASIMYLSFQFQFSTDPTELPEFFRGFKILFVLAFLATAQFAYSLFYTRVPHQFWVFFAAGVVLIVWDWIDPAEDPTYQGVFVSILLVEIARVIVTAVIRRRAGAWIIGLGFAGLILGFAHFFAVILDVLRPVDAPLPIYGGLCLLASMSVFLARTFARTNRDLEEQIVQVQKLSAQTLEQRDQARTELVRERRQRIQVQPHEIEHWTLEDFVGSSASWQSVRSRIRDLQPDDSRTLIHGEAGTGKELVARAIHAGSRRADQAFVAVRCAGLPRQVESLTQRTEALSILFGHTQGAFPGATEDRQGLLQQAQGGTLFFDEVGLLPVALQAHLMRVFAQGEVRLTGASDSDPLDVRVMAATSEDLEMQVEVDGFNRKLYEYLATNVVAVPPLRDRREDIAPLARQIADSASRELGLDSAPISDEVLALLDEYGFPGNVRQLRRTLEQALRMSSGPIKPEDISLQA